VHNLAAFALFTTGFAAAAAGLQFGAFFIALDPVARVAPWLQLVLGLGLIGTAVPYARPRAWVRIPALLLLLLLMGLSVPWVGWMAWNGAFTPLAVFAPAIGFIALLLLVASWRDVGRESARQRAVERENARILAEALANPDPLAPPPPRENRWFLPAVGSLGLPLLTLFGLAVFAPAVLGWAGTRASGVLAGRSPFTAGWVGTPEAYPYSGSPFLWYLEYESRWVPLPEAEIAAVADQVADEVAWKLAAETGEGDPVAAERQLWTEGRQTALPLWIAEALRGRGAFYRPESLLSRSFDPEIHALPDTVHLDCDQLVYLFLHVAWRLDLAMEAVPSPAHVYLKWSAPDGDAALYVETTQFRRVDVSGNRVDFMGQGIGEDFFIDPDYYASGKGGTWASDALVTAAGLYQPWRERDIRDSIVANVLVGLERQRIDAPFQAEMEARLEGSRDITLVANLYGRYLDEAEAAFAAGDPVAARGAAVRAQALRASHGVLVVRGEPVEEAMITRADAMLAPTP